MRDIVLVAAGGGHLQQLELLSKRLPFDGSHRWVTFDTPQSRSLLAGRQVDYVPYIGPRDWRALAKTLPLSKLVGNRRTTEAVVSTGSGMALAFLPRSAALGIPTHYIESATRTDGPSVTGKVFAQIPRIQTYTQYRHWMSRRWQYAGSVFDGFEVVGSQRPEKDRDIKKVVVSLGTIRPYGFRRLVERVVNVLGHDIDIVWQTGCTNVEGLPIEVENQMPYHELVDHINEADVLIAHAGTGISLTAFNAGLCPILVPRDVEHGEHVDNHQSEIGRLLRDSGLAIVRRVEELSYDDLTLAYSRSVVKGDDPATLLLG